jgi:hypothetical protein
MKRAAVQHSWVAAKFRDCNRMAPVCRIKVAHGPGCPVSAISSTIDPAMTVTTQRIEFDTKGHGDTHDPTSRVEELVKKRGRESGLVTPFVAWGDRAFRRRRPSALGAALQSGKTNNGLGGRRSAGGR